MTWRRRRWEKQMDTELRFHMESQIRDYHRPDNRTAPLAAK